MFFTEIYFRLNILQICTPTARPVGGRGPAANWPGGRDLNINKKYIYLHGGPWRGPAAPLPGGRPPAAPPVGGRGAAGPLSPQNYISEPFDVVLNIFDTIRNH